MKILLICFLISLTACGTKMAFDGGPGTTSSQSGSSTGSGGTGKSVSETFIQKSASSSAVDILMVIDNSGSMIPFQEKVATGFSNLIGTLGNASWQMAFTTTDRFDGTLAPLSNGGLILSPSTSKASIVFNDTLKSFGQSGSSDERGILATNSIIGSNNSQTKNFFRKNAALAVVVLSDEDERSTGGMNIKHGDAGTSGDIEYLDTPESVISNMNSFFNNKSFSFYSIIIMPTDNTCYDSDPDGFAGTFYSKLSQMTGGVQGSICDNDYTQTLKNIGNGINALNSSVTVTHIPSTNQAVKVTFTPAQPGITFLVKGNQILFNPPPPEGTKIEVNYVY